MNTLIIYKIRKRGKYFAKQDDSGGKSQDMKSKEAELTAMLLLVTFAFMILVSPIYMAYLVYMVMSPYESPPSFANYMLVAQVCAKTHLTSSGINFYLYCIGGSKFRQDLRAIFCGRQKKAGQPSSNMKTFSSVVTDTNE